MDHRQGLVLVVDTVADFALDTVAVAAFQMMRAPVSYSL